jgi:hypothetical protein
MKPTTIQIWVDQSLGIRWYRQSATATIEMSISIDELGMWVGANALSAAQRTTLYSGNYGQRPSFG